MTTEKVARLYPDWHWHWAVNARPFLRPHTALADAYSQQGSIHCVNIEIAIAHNFHKEKDGPATQKSHA